MEHTMRSTLKHCTQVRKVILPFLNENGGSGIDPYDHRFHYASPLTTCRGCRPFRTSSISWTNLAHTTGGGSEVATLWRWKIGRASCRERVEVWGGGVVVEKTIHHEACIAE